MPDPGPLSQLRKRLEAALGAAGPLLSPVWVDPRPMRDELHAVERAFDSIGHAPETSGLKQAVMAFIRTGTAESFNQLKYVCYGATVPFNDGGETLVDRDAAFDRLLAEVDAKQGDDARRFRRCYQALLQTYFSFTRPADTTSPAEPHRSFKTLRAYLSDRLSVVAKPIGDRQAPAWVITLQEHRNLLSDKPCDRYVDELQGGKTDQLAAVCDTLGIGRGSWVWQEVILAYLRLICDRNDTGFKLALDGALDLAGGQTDLKPSGATATTVVSAVVRRYERATQHPEHPRLRDMSIELIGNPWLKRAAWDAWVAHEPTRQMVDAWLKTRLMEDFFTLLTESSGGATDQRRLNYWLRFVPAITDMWFALGPFASTKGTPEFIEMRKRMDGRWKRFEPSQGKMNNAFIMKIGSYYFIEFAMKGNALYFYREDELPFSLISNTISIYKLKTLTAKSQSHTPSSTWESAFDQKFCPLMGYRPKPRATGGGITSNSTSPTDRGASQNIHAVISSAANKSRADDVAKLIKTPPLTSATADPASSPPWKTASSAKTSPNSTATWVTVPRIGKHKAQPSEGDLKKLLWKCQVFGVKYEDLRQRGGSLWVYAEPTSNPDLVDHLERLGFRFTQKKRGYWLDGED